MKIRKLNFVFLCISILLFANYLFKISIDKSLSNWSEQNNAVKVDVIASEENLQMIEKFIEQYDEKYVLIDKREIVSNEVSSLSTLPAIVNRNININQSTGSDINNGQYYFWGVNNDQFIKIINPLLEVENYIDPMLQKIIINTTFVAVISFLIISLFLTNIAKLNNNFKKCSLLAFEGFERKNIIIHYIKSNFKFDISCILIIFLSFIIIFKIPIIYGLLASIIIFVLLVLNYAIDSFRLARHLRSVTIKVDKKYTYIPFNVTKSIFLSVVISLILVTANLLVVNTEEYKRISNALNIRNQYGMFYGTNSGNDSESFFFSNSFHELENDASDEILPNIDYLFVSPQFDSSNNPSIIVNKRYFDYNTAKDIEGNNINVDKLNPDTCYYFVPTAQIDKFTTEDNCKNEAIIEIADDQSFPTYYPKFPNSDYGLITDTVLMLFPNEIITNQYGSYTNIYYPLDSERQFKDEQYVTSTLRTYGLLDNTGAFQTGYQYVNYLFLGIKVIILGLLATITTLSLLLIYMLFITINQLFKDKYMYATLLRLEGFNIIQSYREILKVIYIGTIIELIIINFISPFKIVTISFWIWIMIIYSVEAVIIILYIKHLESKNQSSILKGEYD